MTPPSTGPRRHSTILTTSTSSSTITAGGSGWPTARGGMTISKGVLLQALPSRFHRSRLKEMPTEHRIRIPAPTGISSPAGTSTARSRVASGTTCLRKRRRRLHGRLSTSLLSDRSQDRRWDVHAASSNRLGALTPLQPGEEVVIVLAELCNKIEIVFLLTRE